MRKIKIYTNSGMPGTIETNVSTLGELKPILRQREINYDGMKMFVGDTRNELSVDEAILPEGDFKLYLFPSQTKSGVDFDDMKDAIERIEDKVDTIILELLSSNVPTDFVAVKKPQQILSAEDQREIDEVRRLSEGRSSDEWDD